MVQAIQKSVTRVCWTRDRYIAAYRAGVLPEPTELIAGDIVEVPRPDPIHEAAIRALMQVLLKALIADSAVTCEKSTPIALSPIDQPVTDVVVMRQDLNLYRNDHPQTDDIYLAVEVANSHPERDRKIKLPQYAAGNVQEYWWSICSVANYWCVVTQRGTTTPLSRFGRMNESAYCDYPKLRST